jgi:hypothetical protein
MEWQMAKQKRIAITTSMLDYLKNIKMMGMANTVMAKIQDSRVFEIAKGNNFRWMLVYFNWSGKIFCRRLACYIATDFCQPLF